MSAAPIVAAQSRGRFGEIAIAGTADDLVHFAQALATPGRIRISGTALPHYPIPIEAVVVLVTDRDVVEIHASEDARELKITGNTEGLKLFAAAVRSLGLEGDPGDHLHFEYFPGHYFLGAGTTSTVIEVLTNSEL